MSDIVERLRSPEYGSKIECEAADEIERLQDALRRIEEWSRAYPLSIFPEPNLPKAAAVLAAGTRLMFPQVIADSARQ